MRVNERDSDIARMIARQGLVDTIALHRFFFEPYGLSMKACERIVTKLQRLGIVCSYTLFDSRKYYTLTPLGARLIDIPDRRAGQPFAAQGLINNYAIMSLCLHGPKKFRRLTRPEFVQGFPELVAPRVLGVTSYRTRYYVDDSDGEVRLGLFVGDYGRNIRRLHKKIRFEAQKRYEANADWNGAVKTHMFSFTVLTFMESKAERIRKLLERERFHSRVCVVESAIDLLPGDE